MGQTRRAFLRDTGTGTLAFWAGCQILHLTPAQARERDIPLRMLSKQQAATLEAFGETLLPGSAAAGLAHFIDHQLAAPLAEQMLMIKYLRVEPPFTAFYTASLEALDGFTRKAHGREWATLDEENRQTITGQLAQADPDGWNGPPAPLVYFVIRNDALDVVYGTVKGVESLGLPYMAHIVPPSRWGE